MIYIPDTDHLFIPSEAKKWCKQHVIISKRDLKRIKKLAKELGFYEELVTLNITCLELAPEYPPEDE